MARRLETRYIFWYIYVEDHMQFTASKMHRIKLTFFLLQDVFAFAIHFEIKAHSVFVK
jgi:hypothetical protein